MTDILSEFCEPCVAPSGAAALEIAMSTTPPDLILLDIMMPDMDGYEVLRRLRLDPVAAGIPVIFLTALSSVKEEQYGLDLGAVDYISKPISPPLVVARVKAHLERHASMRRLASLSEQLSRYLAPPIYQSIFDGSRAAEIKTQRKKLSVFFSDIKDFTRSTAKWQPEDITFLLNSYFSEMSKVVAQFGGTLDKFIGDGMVVFFGDPHSGGVRHDALQCVKMAIAMQQRMGHLHEVWQDMGLDKSFDIRIGINTGYCDVGNFGSDYRMDYTIIGPEVNLAARLEQATCTGGILISAATHALVKGGIEVRPAIAVEAKGFSEALVAYPVVGLLHAPGTASPRCGWSSLNSTESP
ncbi:MAG: putative response regulator, CyC-C [Polaromonas sp.]|nr:putative response regulator, CyC-C [Polaromonas sp.]